MNEGERERRQGAQEVNYKNDGKMMDNQVDTKRRSLICTRASLHSFS